ncbi:hypothetical protein B0A48_04596 [Cryoendolithus antarcticus]|uniref:Mitochondrial import receptor subunit tom22 n=1 Tax=Cryoendolithus antarcticus TaxID=1507870 RepID=A0A1V8TG53_9PEZI|nr:hypothetical protein B0A48_04596 [Cryoendolithus antarcticus]
MVKLEEVPDEEFLAAQPGPKIEEEDDWESDSNSDTSSILSDSLEETLSDRIAALKDIIPPTTRARLSSFASSAQGWVTSGLSFSGKSLWVVSTSALLLGVPWALAFSEEQQMQEMEREMRMQQSANERSRAALPMDPYATAMDTSPAAPTEQAVPTTRITAGTSPPSALQTYHPYAASLYNVSFMWPPKDVPEHGPSHEDDGVNAYTRQDHQVIQEALIVPSSAPDPSRTQRGHPEIEQGSRWESALTSDEALPPHTTSKGAPAATAFQGPRAPYGSQSPYTHGLMQPLAPTRRPPGSSTQNTLPGGRNRHLAFDGAHDTYPPAPSQQLRRKPARLPAQQSSSHLLALDGDGEKGAGDVGGREEHFTWPATMEQVANEADMGRPQWDGSLDEFVDFGAGDRGQQSDFGDVSSSAGADYAPDVPGWLHPPT